VRHKRRSYREPDDDEDFDDDLAAVNERLDDLTRQLERMARANAAPRNGDGGNERAPDRVADALARLDRRLDQVIAEGRATAGEFERRPRRAPVPPPMPAPPPPAQAHRDHSNGPSSWTAQISARQRALDGGLTAPRAAAAMPALHQPQSAPANWDPAADLSGLEQQLRQINTQISALHLPYEDGFAALRSDLAEIGRSLTEAMPRRAIEALEAEVRALSERIDHSRQAGAEGAALAAVERELAEIREALRSLTPAESLAGFQDAVHALSHKIDQIAATQQMPQDSLAFKQLEQAVVSLRGVVSNVASDGALAQLAAEVRGLAAQFERAAADSSSEALSRLDAHIATLMESGRAVPPELEGSIRELSERLDRMQLSQSDQLALGVLEDRIAKLSEKLDASDSRLAHLEAIERGLADLLVHLEEIRKGGATSLRAPAPPEPAPAPAAPPQPAPAAPAAAPAFAQSPPLDLIPEMPQPAPAEVDEPAPPEPAVFAQPAPAPAAVAPAEVYVPPQPAPMPPPTERRPQPQRMARGERQPIDPNLPPDAPLEPGSGAPRMRPGSAAARIAASEAALASMRPMAAEAGGKSAAIAAARNAAKVAYLDTPVKMPKSLGPKPARSLGWPFKKKAKAPPAPQLQMPTPSIVPPAAPAPVAVPMPPSMPALPPGPADDRVIDPPMSRGKQILKIFKTLLIAASVAIIVVGTFQTAMEFLFPDTPANPPSAPAASSPPESTLPKSTPSRPMPTPEGTLPAPSAPAAPPPTDSDTTNSIGNNPSSFFDPSTIIKLPDITGSIGRSSPPPRAKVPAHPPARSSAADTLPASIGPVLRTAALANNPAAEYELGSRYAEGRTVPQNMNEAVRWLERAANAGFAPAEFRLASLYEKGEGVKRSTQEARRLYLAAASQGHAKAMHNLAVLYAEGADGKPDYKVAAEWFRKAAMYGVTDSQFNLAILYARGIGVTTNLAESYRWFAIAAAHGDHDAARKRDEVAARLDQQTLMAAKVAAQSFVPDREPNEAVNLRTPPGGWDHAPVAPAKPRHRVSDARTPASTVQ
jgi:localization factor PodJL